MAECPAFIFVAAFATEWENKNFYYFHCLRRETVAFLARFILTDQQEGFCLDRIIVTSSTHRTIFRCTRVSPIWLCFRSSNWNVCMNSTSPTYLLLNSRYSRLALGLLLPTSLVLHPMLLRLFSQSILRPTVKHCCSGSTVMPMLLIGHTYSNVLWLI